jgi:Putative bacterial sensory transduction regulator
VKLDAVRRTSEGLSGRGPFAHIPGKPMAFLDFFRRRKVSSDGALAPQPSRNGSHRIPVSASAEQAAGTAASSTSSQSDAHDALPGGTMSDDLITATSVTKDLLRSVFDAAFMDYRTDSDGDLVVSERCNVFVFPDAEKKRIRLMTLFSFTPIATMSEKLEATNKINREYLFVRATVANDRLMFDYDISIDHGVTKKALVLMIKRFAQIPHAAVHEHATDIVT